jgi:hypothetical protein
MKPNINGAEVHPQLSNNDHPVDGALVGAGSMWSSFITHYNLATKNEAVPNHPSNAVRSQGLEFGQILEPWTSRFQIQKKQKTSELQLGIKPASCWYQKRTWTNELTFIAVPVKVTLVFFW